MDIRKFGQRLKLEESKTAKVKKEKEVFIENITLLEQCFKRADELHDMFSVDLYMYEEPFLVIIENMFLLKYGEVVSEIIFWYVHDRVDADGKINPLFYEEEGKEPVEMVIKTPTELWKFIEKLLKTIK